MYGVFGVAMRGGVQRRARQGPRALCFRDGDCEAASERSRFGGFHSVGRWITLQQHYGVRSCMAVACSVQGYLFLLFFFRCWIVPWWRLHVQEKVACRTGLA